ncbi:hypothetical protein AMATHDRAFT_71681 [Amanita thiersii Skay4041]|uniref:Uncharacterized protein n=1 Tax=Amanita thiersii Skay4041 TaxID=703135 RepID=A0A2A9N8N0_9AGAR|nr:hypothetical protein AMATHDRAFT_71681 [Amanita thiersii Skay4041]
MDDDDDDDDDDADADLLFLIKHKQKHSYRYDTAQQPTFFHIHHRSLILQDGFLHTGRSVSRSPSQRG